MWKLFMIYGLVCQVIGVERIDDGIIERYNYFNIELLQVVNELIEGNVVISPLSIKTALTILSEGTGGRTREELLSSLRLPTADRQEIRDISRKLLQSIQNYGLHMEIDLANRLWIGHSIQISDEYNNLLQSYYGGDMQSIEFTNANAPEMINKWVRKATRNHIQSIINSNSLIVDSSLVLTSALYLKGKWKMAFDEDATRDRCFNVPERGCAYVPMMEHQSTFPYSRISSLKADVLEIPYDDERFSMLILLPVQQGLQHLQILSRDLNHKSVGELLRSLRNTELILQLPRFTIESKIDLQSSLEYLGIRDLFGFNANLSGILPTGGIRVGSVVHSAKIEINEQGTVASAATAFQIIPLMGSTREVFRVDRPFLFIIAYRPSNTIIFAGRVIQP